jgi:hypothetical protein
MIALLRGFRAGIRPRRAASRRGHSAAVDGLEGRCTPSASGAHRIVGRAAESRRVHDLEFNGTVVKRPSFYEDYSGPRLAQFNAVGATGTLRGDGCFHFLGVNRGVIDPNLAARYVFGVDRNGRLPVGPFPGRPDIRFDALVIVTIVPGESPAASVMDMANMTSKALPGHAVRLAGRGVAVTVPGRFLPSTGLAPERFRYNFWPEDGRSGPANIASFAPEFHDIRVGFEPNP